MKNEIEKRQREEEINADANQSSQESLEAAQNGIENDEPTLSNGVDAKPTKLVAC